MVSSVVPGQFQRRPSGPSSTYGPVAAVPRRGFTLIELVVVISIILILLVALLTAGRAMITKGKVRETKTVMENLNMAIEQFRAEAPLKNVVKRSGYAQGYADRYGNYPCDELDAFTKRGIRRGNDLILPSIATGRGALHTPSGGTGAIEDQDIKAMALSIRLYSPEASTILDRIDARYRRAPGDSAEFFDRDPDDGPTAKPQDESLTYFVDAWGTALGYFATLPPDTGGRSLRDEMTLRFHNANSGKPLLMSYGPNGQEQLSEDYGELSLLADFGPGDATPGVIDNPLNEDNVYLDDSIKDRLREPRGD